MPLDVLRYRYLSLLPEDRSPAGRAARPDTSIPDPSPEHIADWLGDPDDEIVFAAAAWCMRRPPFEPLPEPIQAALTRAIPRELDFARVTESCWTLRLDRLSAVLDLHGSRPKHPLAGQMFERLQSRPWLDDLSDGDIVRLLRTYSSPYLTIWLAALPRCHRYDVLTQLLTSPAAAGSLADVGDLPPSVQDSVWMRAAHGVADARSWYRVAAGSPSSQWPTNVVHRSAGPGFQPPPPAFADALLASTREVLAQSDLPDAVRSAALRPLAGALPYLPIETLREVVAFAPAAFSHNRRAISRDDLPLDLAVHVAPMASTLGDLRRLLDRWHGHPDLCAALLATDATLPQFALLIAGPTSLHERAWRRLIDLLRDDYAENPGACRALLRDDLPQVFEYSSVQTPNWVWTELVRRTAVDTESVIDLLAIGALATPPASRLIVASLPPDSAQLLRDALGLRPWLLSIPGLDSAAAHAFPPDDAAEIVAMSSGDGYRGCFSMALAHSLSDGATMLEAALPHQLAALRPSDLMPLLTSDLAAYRALAILSLPRIPQEDSPAPSSPERPSPARA